MISSFRHRSKPNGEPWPAVFAMLADPPSEYRPAPLWAWNDHLEDEALRRQVRLHREAGLGGFFIHARAGLRVQYLSEEWERLLRLVLDEAESEGLLPWFYDEWGWPSGMSGGAIPALGKEHQQKFLRFESTTADQAAARDHHLAAFTPEGELLDPRTSDPNCPVLSAYIEYNSAYADVLYPPTIDRFIETTYEWHRERFSNELGRLVPGFFTDEPQYGRYGFPWSTNLEERFTERFGYSLVSVLPSLAHDVGNFRMVRSHFWSMVADCFVQAYAEKLGQWCARNECHLTGHALLEEDCRWQTMCCGTAQGFYRHQQIPGIDWLGRRIGNVVIGKQVSSVADQLGRRRVLSEMFAAGGWNSTLADMKNIADWQFVTGVNLMCPHLEPYTIRGARKRDYPPFPFFQAPWWPYYPAFNNRFARLSALLANGRTCATIMVVHPIRSAWMEIDQGPFTKEMARSPQLKRIDDDLEALCTALSRAHLDYHLADEAILRDEARAEDAAILLGDYRYTAVILPTSGTLLQSTVALLQQAAEIGVPLFRMPIFPDRIEGKVHQSLERLAKSFHLIEHPETAPLLLRPVAKPRVRMSVSHESLLSLAKSYEGADGAFIVNLNQEQAFATDVFLEGEGSLQEIDLDTGQLQPLSNGPSASLHFAPGQSRFLVRTNSSAEGTCSHAPAKVIVQLQGWTAVPAGPNALTLDYCRWREAGTAWSHWKPAIEARRELLEGGRDMDLELEYRFEAASDFSPATPLHLVIEDATLATVEMNGDMLPIPDHPETWIDDPLQCIPIGGRVRAGTNVVRVAMRFANAPHVYEQIRRAANHEQVENMLAFDTEVESIYLRGHFTLENTSSFEIEEHCIRTNGPFVLREGLAQLDPAIDATMQGYPFYRGSFVWQTQLHIPQMSESKTWLCMDPPKAAAIQVRINGEPAGTICWPPYELDVSGCLRQGWNNIELTLVGTNRNLFGPHHHPAGELLALGPPQFGGEDGWDARYAFVSFGLRGRQWIEVRECRSTQGEKRDGNQ